MSGHYSLEDKRAQLEQAIETHRRETESAEKQRALAKRSLGRVANGPNLAALRVAEDRHTVASAQLDEAERELARVEQQLANPEVAEQLDAIQRAYSEAGRFDKKIAPLLKNAELAFADLARLPAQLKAAYEERYAALRDATHLERSLGLESEPGRFGMELDHVMFRLHEAVKRGAEAGGMQIHQLKPWLIHRWDNG
jgi:hypothetical protein